MIDDLAPAWATGSAPPRICHLIATNFAGGPEKQILQLSLRLRDHGWPAVIGSFLEGRAEVELIEQARGEGLDTFFIDTGNSFDPRAVTQLRSRLRERSIEVLITHGYKANLVGRLATVGTAVVQVPVLRGFTGEDRKVRVYEAIDRLVLRTFRNVLSVSHASRRLLIDHGLRPESVHVLHNAVDCARPVEPIDLVTELSLPRDSRVVVAAGRLSPEKGQRFLVDAMARVLRQNPRVYALILGEGQDRAALEQQISGAGLDGHVFLPGFRKDVLQCLAGADVVVNPSLSEGLPNVVLEAMSVSTAVVATDVGGVAELIHDGETGWLVPAGDAEALARAVLDALEDDLRRERTGRSGREFVERSFSFEEQARRFVEFVRSLPGLPA